MKRFIALFATLFISISTFAQSDYFQNRRQEFASFIEKRQSEFARFRDSVNLEYTKFMRSAWQKYYGEEPIPAPEVEPVPVIDYETEPKPKPIETKPIEFEITAGFIVEERLFDDTSDYYDIYVSCSAWNHANYEINQIGGSGWFQFTHMGVLIDSLPSGYVQIGKKYAAASHTHSYAGSSSAGGSATSAV